MKGKLTIIVCLAAFVIGMAVGWYCRIRYIQNRPLTRVEVRDDSGSYHFINPLLFINDTRESPTLQSLKSTLDQFITISRDGLNVSDVSVYFRDLNNASWISINPNQKYLPSSMMKVAVMMSYLKKAESKPDILAENLYYNASAPTDQYYKTGLDLKSGYYTVRYLIQIMIQNSDNIAAAALINNNLSGFEEIYKILRLSIPENENDDFMTASDYAIMWRTLYNSSYLSHEISDQALQLLTNTSFKNGLMQGLPVGTVVAHKFGEHTSYGQNHIVLSRQLHDCGIIYYPEHPYLLCVMTKGADFPGLEKVISEISQRVYAFESNK